MPVPPASEPPPAPGADAPGGAGPDRVVESAPAKVNLALAVGPRRDDGRHEVCTWMATIDLADELEVVRLDPDRLSRYAILWHDDALRRTDVDWSITRDLAVQAHLALERRLGRRLPVQLKLEKRIPVAAGLAGGSADAAAMLRALDRLFALDLGPDELRTVADGLGSDVPFLIEGGTALARGAGEIVEPLPGCLAAGLEAAPIVLVMPEASCPTAVVYARLAALREAAAAPARLREDEVRELAASSAPLAARPLFNDLAGAAIAVAPTIGETFAAASRIADRPVHLTGSGACGFICCDDEPHAEALARTLRDEHGLAARAGRTIFPTR